MLRIASFFSLATLISAIFRFQIIDVAHYLTWSKGITDLINALLVGVGVLLAALIAKNWLSKDKKVTLSLLGDQPRYSLLMSLVPILLLTIMGVQNQYAFSSHTWGFLSITISLLYCIMEEYGWRGYLEEELSFVKPWIKYGIIGTLWYTWHLSFLAEVTLLNQLLILFLLIMGSWGLGELVRYTKSILVVACFHLLIQIMFFNTFFRNSLSGQDKLIVFGILILSWLIVLKLWQQKVPDVQKGV